MRIALAFQALYLDILILTTTTYCGIQKLFSYLCTICRSVICIAHVVKFVLEEHHAPVKD